jgi:NAD(P)H-dependent FMN reductase
MTKIAIIVGSTRPTRFADKPVAWLQGLTAQRSDATYEVLDLRDYPMPFFDEMASNAYMPSQNEVVVRWQRKLAEFDGYVIVTAEYNHAPTGVLKNALDQAYVEWNKKPVAFVGYGSVGAARAIEQLRTIAIELQMAPIRTAVHIQGADFFGAWQQGAALEDMAHLQPGVTAMFDELSWWAGALKAARDAGAAGTEKITDEQTA